MAGGGTAVLQDLETLKLPGSDIHTGGPAEIGRGFTEVTDTTFVSRRERRRQAKPSLARAVVNNTGPLGRGAAVAVAASGLVITSGAAASASGPGGPDEGRDYSSVEVPTTEYTEDYTAEQSADYGAEQDLDYPAEQAVETEDVSQDGGEAGDIVPASNTSESPSGGDGSVVGAAHDGLGTPYVWGGKSAGGWDCSGFASWAYAQAGKDIPSNTYAMMDSMEQVSEPSPGDLVIQNGGAHVAIYVGNGQLIGANNPSVGTTMYPLDSPYWSNTMFLTA